MKRIIFDTSVYGKLSEDPEATDVILQKLSKEFIIYGTEVIKNELRETPKHVFHRGRNLRNILLSLYHSLVKKDSHYLRMNKLIETLARDYMAEYRKKGGSLSAKAMRNDLLIIATATIYKLDIVVADDERSMLSTAAISAYKATNKSYGMPDPVFKPYRVFRSELLENQERPL